MSSPISIIAGLGNPGDKYRDTRHNAGFWFIDRLADAHRASWKYEKRFDADVAKTSIAGEELWFIKPMAFMNLSGGPIRGLADYYRLDLRALLVVHDELDLPPGTVRLKKGGGHGGHNGLRDIINHCGADFYRLRIGIGHPGTRDQVLGYVLRPPSADDESTIRDAIERTIGEVPDLIRRGPDVVMNSINRKRPPAVRRA
jgi:PTH1 family peptidyl-tRNA hydrolase